MDNYSEKLLGELQTAIEKVAFPPTPEELYGPMKYTLALGGKRIRPLLAMLAADIFDGRNQDTLHTALAVELFHNFTLIHDDIMDNAPVRRGKPTVHVKWNRDIAILSGDGMMIKAYQYLSRCSSEILPELLKVFNDTAMEVCEGQQMDMNFEKTKDVSVDQYIRMIELKTAVLLGASLKMGGISAGASPQDAQLIYEFGRNIGIAFQLKDDWLDVYADPDKFGKIPGGDILAGKKTYLLIKAMELGNDTQKDDVSKLLDGNNSWSDEEKVDRIRGIYDELNLSDLLTEEASGYFNKGLENLEKISVNKDRKLSLRVLAELLMAREN